MIDWFEQLADISWLPSSPKSVDVVEIWREKIFFLTFVSLAVVGLFPLGMSLKYSFQVRRFEYALGITLLYLFIIIVPLSRRLPFRFRAWTGLAIYYAYGVISLINIGPTGSVRVWLLSMSVISGLFLGLQASISVLVLTIGTIFAAGWAVKAGYLTWTVTTSSAISGWPTTSVTFAFLNIVSTTAVGILVHNMEKLLRSEQNLTAALSRTNEQLRREVSERKRAEDELRQAYDSTLEGWVKALEIRDRETSGHSQRVVEMTVKLARVLNIPNEEIIHLRRGALLHDIGKLGIPDSILLKPGPLSEKEWGVMRLHPQYAYEWLSTIQYLQPALAIPLHHHEKWDGTGYPYGLKGEEIPLAARIFTIVDMWDALCSDRPYRKAWSRAHTIAWMRERSGEYFDPEILEVFLELLTQENLFNDQKN